MIIEISNISAQENQHYVYFKKQILKGIKMLSTFLTKKQQKSQNAVLVNQFVAAIEACCEIVWLKGLLRRDESVPVDNKLNIDNEVTKQLADNPESQGKHQAYSDKTFLDYGACGIAANQSQPCTS